MPAASDTGGRRTLRFKAVRPAAGSAGATIHVALVGKPNSGKTTLFNALTGLRQKVGNYPGVTVERKEGAFSHAGRNFRLTDLPGTYSLNATSDDEALVREALLGLSETQPRPDVVLLIVDASNPERCLFLASQVAELGLACAIALTMNDEAQKNGVELDAQLLHREMGLPVVPINAPRSEGLGELKSALLAASRTLPSTPVWQPDGLLAEAVSALTATAALPAGIQSSAAQQLALSLLLSEEASAAGALRVAQLASQWRSRLDADLPAWRQAEAQWRYRWVQQLLAKARTEQARDPRTWGRRVDDVLTHPLWGLLAFALVMAVLFQSIFTWATPLMDGISAGFHWLGQAVSTVLPEGPLRGLLVDGVLGGVGSVLVFLPQILLLFLFITLLEDSGYMARAAFMMNKHMRRCGLHGRSFIPLLSGFACAIPAIMSTRSIADRRDRLVTILAVPFISCSARLPVYALLIACFIPATRIFAGFTLQGAVLWSAYIISVLAAIGTAFLLRRTVLRGPNSAFIMELPPYRWPNLRNVLHSMWERGKLFLTQAGTVILCISILLWLLSNFPQQPGQHARYESLRAQAVATTPSGAVRDEKLSDLTNAEASERLQSSYAGRLGHIIEPAIRPLGFDWKIGVGLIASFAAREVLVSTLAIVYGVGNADESSASLQDKLRREINPQTHRPVFNTLVALNLMLFFILACQCMSTVAVVRRETNSWKWPAFMVLYMTGTAYLVCLIFYQAGSRLLPGLL